MGYNWGYHSDTKAGVLALCIYPWQAETYLFLPQGVGIWAACQYIEHSFRCDPLVIISRMETHIHGVNQGQTQQLAIVWNERQLGFISTLSLSLSICITFGLARFL